MNASKTASKSYFILIVIYLAGLAAPVNQFKVPPMMQQLMRSFDISLMASGWLMTVFALVGLVVAIPTSFILKRFGNKITALTALALLLAGSLTGTFAPSAPVILISRVIEGVGMCIFSITAPTAIAAWFSPDKRGIPTGIWVTWVPVGTMIIYTAAPLVADSKWQPVWWFASVYTVFAFVLFLIFFRMPEGAEKERVETARGIKLPKKAVINILLVAAVFMLFNTITISIKSYLPTFLELVRGYSQGKASGIINVMIVVSVFMGPLTGIISDKIGSRRIPMLTGCAITCVCAAATFSSSAVIVTASLFMMGIACGNVASMCFTAASEIPGDPSKASTGLSIVAFGQYTGMSAGPIVFSTIADKLGWLTAGYFLVPVAALALLCAFIVKIK